MSPLKPLEPTIRMGDCPSKAFQELSNTEWQDTLGEYVVFGFMQPTVRRRALIVGQSTNAAGSHDAILTVRKTRFTPIRHMPVALDERIVAREMCVGRKRSESEVISREKAGVRLKI
jgi:hypothetical protein